MLKYETVIYIVNEGFDRFDAGEKAGEIIDSSKMMDGMVLRCEPTRLYKSVEQVNIDSSRERCLVEA